jgi:hypothetical protein
MDSILVNDKINDYFNKLIKKNSSLPVIPNYENTIINTTSFYDTYIKQNIILIFLIIAFVVYFIFQIYFGTEKIKTKKNKPKKFVDNFSSDYNYNNNDNNTVFSEEDRQNLIKIIDDLTIENYKHTLNNNTAPATEPQQQRVIKEMNGNLNGDFLNVNNGGKYNSVINGILVESPFA